MIIIRIAGNFHIVNFRIFRIVIRKLKLVHTKICTNKNTRYTVYTCTLSIYTTAQPPLVKCGSISELLEDGMCDCSCIEIKGPGGMMPKKGPKKDSCPVCEMTCSDEMPTGIIIYCRNPIRCN